MALRAYVIFPFGAEEFTKGGTMNKYYRTVVSFCRATHREPVFLPIGQMDEESRKIAEGAEEVLMTTCDKVLICFSDRVMTTQMMREVALAKKLGKEMVSYPKNGG